MVLFSSRIRARDEGASSEYLAIFFEGSVLRRREKVLLYEYDDDDGVAAWEFLAMPEICPSSFRTTQCVRNDSPKRERFGEFARKMPRAGRKTNSPIRDFRTSDESRGVVAKSDIPLNEIERDLFIAT